MSALQRDACPQCGAGLPPAGEQVICEYCGSRFLRQRAAEPPDGSTAFPDRLIRGMRFRLHTCQDTQGLGLEAFRLLVPAGWEFRGGVFWVMDKPGRPANVGFQVWNPAGPEVFEVFPALTFFWTGNPLSQMTFPRGSVYYGNEVQPPLSARQAMTDMVLPRYRSQVGPVTLAGLVDLPELPRQLGLTGSGQAAGGHSATGAKARIHYTWGGRELEEEIFGVAEVQRVAVPSLFGAMENIFWSLDYLFGCRALAGKLDSLAGLFQTMAFSFRLNPRWFASYLQVSQQMIQNQIRHIHQIGDLSRMIHQTHEQISDQIMESYNRRQASMDRVAENFSQTIRGVDEYQNPFEGRGVELPAGYGHAWANSLGEYIVTDDPNFNPNPGSNLTWEPLARKQ